MTKGEHKYVPMYVLTYVLDKPYKGESTVTGLFDIYYLLKSTYLL